VAQHINLATVVTGTAGLGDRKGPNIELKRRKPRGAKKFSARFASTRLAQLRLQNGLSGQAGDLLASRVDHHVDAHDFRRARFRLGEYHQRASSPTPRHD